MSLDKPKFLREIYSPEVFPLYDIGLGSYGDLSILAWDSKTRIKIGNYSSFAFDTCAILGGEHRIDWGTTYPFSKIWPEAAHIEGHPASHGDINIGADVWVGGRSTILSGVTIGHGAIIGAGSLVHRDVDPYAIVAGNPARFIRWRYEIPKMFEARSRLLEIAWWDWPPERIAKALPLLLQPDIQAFIGAVDSGTI